MNILERIDESILELFTKFSHWFQRLTGRTNYFLAKICVFLMITSMLFIIINIWVPILSYIPSSTARLFEPFLFLIGMLACILQIYILDKSENNLYEASERVRAPSFFEGSYRWRLVLGLMSILFLSLFFLPDSRKGILIANIFFYCYPLFFWLASYFVMVDPLPPGKSKVRQWVENIQAGFQKRQPLPSGGR